MVKSWRNSLAGVLCAVLAWGASPSFADTAVIILPNNRGQVIDSGRRFDGKAVMCRKRGRNFFEAGRVGQSRRGAPTWMSLESRSQTLVRAGKLTKASRYQEALPRLAETCRRSWTEYLRPNVISKDLSVLRRREVAFSLEATGPGSPVIEVKTWPRRGSVVEANGTYRYISDGVFVGQETLTFVAKANGYTSRVGTIAFRVQDCRMSAADLQLSAPEGQDVVFEMPIQDTCFPEEPLQAQVTDAASSGQVILNGRTVTYRPQQQSTLGDAFELEAQNPLGERLRARVVVGFQAVSTDFAGNPNLLGRYRENLSEAEVHSVLDRVAFGGTPEQRGIRTLTALVNSLLDDDENPLLDQMRNDENLYRLAKSQRSDAFFNSRWFFSDTTVAAMGNLRYGNPFRNWMAFAFWHNHFATNLTEFSNSGSHLSMPDHIDRLHRNALGNFRDFVGDMLTDLPFHLYLNNFDNTVAEPNENFGREFLELFTAGIKDPVRGDANFDEMDVVASTRALSGYYFGSDSAAGLRLLTSGLPAPRNLEASDGALTTLPSGEVTYDSMVRLSWSPVYSPNARYFVVERAPLGSQQWSMVRRFNYSYSIYPPSSSDSAAGQVGVGYQYRVRIEGVGGVLGPPSNVDTGHVGYAGAPPNAPSSISASAGTEGSSVTINWGPVSGAAGYRVMRKRYDGGVWTALGSNLPAGTTSFSDATVVPNTVYRYQVKAMNSAGAMSELNQRDTAVYGVDYAHGYITEPQGSATPPSRVVGSEARSDGVLVSWEPSPDAAAYRVYRSPPWIDAPEVVGTIFAPSTSFLDTSAPAGTLQWYSVWPIDSQGRIGRPAEAGFSANRWNRSASDLTPLRFLSSLPAGHPNAAAVIAEPGVPMSAQGWSFKGQPEVLSFVDHVLYNWPATSRQIAAKLFAHIAHRQLTEEIVSDLSQQLLAHDYDIKATLRVILSSSAMFAAEANHTCVKSPLEAQISFQRLLDIPATTFDTRWRNSTHLSAAGYGVFDPPSVFGWKNCGVVRGGVIEDGSQWTLSSQTYIALGNGLSGVLYEATIPASGSYPGEGLNLMAHFVPEGASAQPAVVVDRIAAKLGVTLTAAQRSLMIEYLNTDNLNRFSQFNGVQHRDRVTGLIRIISMSSDFLTK